MNVTSAATSGSADNGAADRDHELEQTRPTRETALNLTIEPVVPSTAYLTKRRR
jgi:hypothetical protein